MDTLGNRAKIGVVVPSTNTAVQPEMEAMRPWGVTNHIGRMAIANRPLRSDADFEALIADLMGAQDAAVDGVMSCEPDHLVLGLSAETFWDGIEAGRAATQALRERAGVGVSAAADALVDCLAACGFRRIGVVTPYQPVGDERVRQFFEASGFEVVAMAGLRCASPVQTAWATRRELIAALRDLARTGTDAIVQVGTNLPMAEVAREAFDWLGLPVLAANTVLYRDALDQLGLLDAAGFDARWLPFRQSAPQS
ncbi:maleate cis-trans isomerase family protein [Neoaquamicrobium sediminum]|uniref:maleate cis-trans isomerase family protein n=1 Tax=Neoaquamicrobium sediminum TaxID=1849104 RepID=UPI003BA95E15